MRSEELKKLEREEKELLDRIHDLANEIDENT